MNIPGRESLLQMTLPISPPKNAPAIPTRVVPMHPSGLRVLTKSWAIRPTTRPVSRNQTGFEDMAKSYDTTSAQSELVLGQALTE